MKLLPVVYVPQNTIKTINTLWDFGLGSGFIVEHVYNRDEIIAAVLYRVTRLDVPVVVNETKQHVIYTSAVAIDEIDKAMATYVGVSNELWK